MTDAGEQTGHAEAAAVPVASAPSNIVLVGDHTVTLHPHAPLGLGIAASRIFSQGGNEAVMLGRLAELYLTFGVASWTFTDAKGNVEPITNESIERLLPFEDGGLEVAEACDALYGEAVTAPLVRRLNKSLPVGPTDDSTSPNPDSGSTPPTPSEPSSPSTSEDGPPFEDPAP